MDMKKIIIELLDKIADDDIFLNQLRTMLEVHINNVKERKSR